MCIEANLDTARAARMRQHARDFKNERAAEINPGRWLSDGELAKLASSGAIQGTKKPPRMSWRLRYLLLAMWSTSISLSIWTIASLATHLPKAITWVASHLGPVAAASSL